jgi:hypothetical protein
MCITLDGTMEKIDSKKTSVMGNSPKRVYNAELAETLGLTDQQKNLLHILYKLYSSTEYGPYDRSLLYVSSFDEPWEALIALASNREKVTDIDELMYFLQPLSTTVPLREELPWRAPVLQYNPQMCGAARKRSNVPCRNEANLCHRHKAHRKLIQLLKINRNTLKSWRLPYYFEIPQDGCYSLRNSILKGAVAISYSGGFKIPLSKLDYLLCQDGKCYILLAVNGHYIRWGHIRHFGFTTSTQLSWREVHWRDIATAAPAGINSTVYTDLDKPEATHVPYFKQEIRHAEYVQTLVKPSANTC